MSATNRIHFSASRYTNASASPQEHRSNKTAELQTALDYSQRDVLAHAPLSKQVQLAPWCSVRGESEARIRQKKSSAREPQTRQQTVKKNDDEMNEYLVPTALPDDTQMGASAFRNHIFDVHCVPFLMQAGWKCRKIRRGSRKKEEEEETAEDTKKPHVVTDLQFVPPGVEARAPFQSRKDYFDSRKLLMEHLNSEKCQNDATVQRVLRFLKFLDTVISEESKSSKKSGRKGNKVEDVVETFGHRVKRVVEEVESRFLDGFDGLEPQTQTPPTEASTELTAQRAALASSTSTRPGTENPEHEFEVVPQSPARTAQSTSEEKLENSCKLSKSARPSIECEMSMPHTSSDSSCPTVADISREEEEKSTNQKRHADVLSSDTPAKVSSARQGNKTTLVPFLLRTMKSSYDRQEQPSTASSVPEHDGQGNHEMGRNSPKHEGKVTHEVGRKIPKHDGKVTREVGRSKTVAPDAGAHTKMTSAKKQMHCDTQAKTDALSKVTMKKSLKKNSSNPLGRLLGSLATDTEVMVSKPATVSSETPTLTLKKANLAVSSLKLPNAVQNATNNKRSNPFIVPSEAATLRLTKINQAGSTPQAVPVSASASAKDAPRRESCVSDDAEKLTDNAEKGRDTAEKLAGSSDEPAQKKAKIVSTSPSTSVSVSMSIPIPKRRSSEIRKPTNLQTTEPSASAETGVCAAGGVIQRKESLKPTKKGNEHSIKFKPDEDSLKTLSSIPRRRKVRDENPGDLLSSLTAARSSGSNNEQQKRLKVDPLDVSKGSSPAQYAPNGQSNFSDKQAGKKPLKFSITFDSKDPPGIICETTETPAKRQSCKVLFVSPQTASIDARLVPGILVVGVEIKGGGDEWNSLRVTSSEDFKAAVSEAKEARAHFRIWFLQRQKKDPKFHPLQKKESQDSHRSTRERTTFDRRQAVESSEESHVMFAGKTEMPLEVATGISNATKGVKFSGEQVTCFLFDPLKSNLYGGTGAEIEFDSSPTDSNAALFDATLHGSFKDVADLLQRGAHALQRDADSKTALHYANELAGEVQQEIQDLTSDFLHRSELDAKAKDILLKKKLLKIYQEAEQVMDAAQSLNEWKYLEIVIEGCEGLEVQNDDAKESTERSIFCTLLMDDGKTWKTTGKTPLTASPSWKTHGRDACFGFNYSHELFDRNPREMMELRFYMGDPTAPDDSVYLGNYCISMDAIAKVVKKKQCGSMQTGIISCYRPLEAGTVKFFFRDLREQTLDLILQKGMEGARKLGTLLEWISAFQDETSSQVATLTNNLVLPINGNFSLLHAAVSFGNLTLTKRLLDSGADPLSRSYDGSAVEIARDMEKKFSSCESDRLRNAFGPLLELLESQASCGEVTPVEPAKVLAKPTQKIGPVGNHTIVGKEESPDGAFPPREKGIVCKMERPEEETLPAHGKAQGDSDRKVSPTTVDVPELLPSIDEENWAAELIGKRSVRCRFFQTDKGCKRGASCHFSHVHLPMGTVWKTQASIPKKDCEKVRGSVLKRMDQNMSGEYFYTAAFHEEETNALYYAEGGSGGFPNEQGLYWYRSLDCAIKAAEQTFAAAPPQSTAVLPQSGSQKKKKSQTFDKLSHYANGKGKDKKPPWKDRTIPSEERFYGKSSKKWRSK